VKHPGSKRTAFTLVESLVVLVILALLATLLVSVTKRALKAAQSAKCMQNLRDISSGVFQYSAEHNGALPFHYVENAPFGGFGGPLWYVEVAPYVGVAVKTDFMGELEKPGPFKCPADKIPWVASYPNAFRPSCSYAPPMDLTRLMSGWGEDGKARGGQLRTTTATRPASTVMLVDCNFGNVFNPGMMKNPAFKASNDPDESSLLLPERHGGLNALFLDGHLEFLRAPIETSAPADRPRLWGPAE